MEARHLNLAVKESLRVYVPHLDEVAEEWLDTFPSPPPPTPSRPKRDTPYDAQRFDPFKVMLAATSPPRYPSPTAAEFAIEYPNSLPDTLMLHFPSIDVRPPHEHPFDSNIFPEFKFEPPKSTYKSRFKYHFDEDSDESSWSSDPATPEEEVDDLALAPSDVRTTYRFEGGKDDSECPTDRTIVRPLPPRRFDLTRSLASATLRTMSSLSSLKGSLAGPKQSPSALHIPASELGERPRISTSTKSTGESGTLTDGTVPPPVSRRPSIVALTSAAALPSVSSLELAERLRRLALGLGLGCGPGGAERHFEETVGHYEKAWPREACGEGGVEVNVTRTVTEKATVLSDADSCSFPLDCPEAQRRHCVRPDGIGIYSNLSPRSRQTTLRSEDLN